MRLSSSKTRSKPKRVRANSRRILVTGGSGFIGSAFLRRFVSQYPSYLFVNFDNLSSSVDPEALKGLDKFPNYQFVKGDISNIRDVIDVFKKYIISDVIHFAADSDVDHSIRKPWLTYKANVEGTQNLLDLARTVPDFRRFVYVSTDEVYGPAPRWNGDLNTPNPYGPQTYPGEFKGFLETDRLAPQNPYSASKAAAEHMVVSYANTYDLNYVITRGCNSFGPWQAPTKLIPRAVKFLAEGNGIPVYGEGQAIREWIHVDAHADAIFWAFINGKSGEVYNVGSDVSLNTLEVAKMIIGVLGERFKITFVADRPGHDMRYAISFRKIVNEGWTPPHDRSMIISLIKKTVKWFWNYERKK